MGAFLEDAVLEQRDARAAVDAGTANADVRPQAEAFLFFGLSQIRYLCGFTGSDGIQVPLEDTISSFKAVVAGEYDHLPEQAFYMVGNMEEAIEKAKKL